MINESNNVFWALKEILDLFTVPLRPKNARIALILRVVCTVLRLPDLFKGGGGGGGVRPIILETLIMRYGLKGKARTRPNFFRVVLGPCAQFYPCEASEQK